MQIVASSVNLSDHHAFAELVIMTYFIVGSASREKGGEINAAQSE